MYYIMRAYINMKQSPLQKTNGNISFEYEETNRIIMHFCLLYFKWLMAQAQSCKHFCVGPKISCYFIFDVMGTFCLS